MKNVIFSVILTIFFCSCKKDTPIFPTKASVDYSNLVTIKQGLWGSCSYLTGNCMPGSSSTCKQTPVKRTIYIYSATNETQAVHIVSNFYSQINTTLVGQIQSDDNGFYQISLQVGQYSILILEQGKYYTVSWDGLGLLTPVTIDSSATTRRDLVIDMSVQ
jgi:hypothetical protein